MGLTIHYTVEFNGTTKQLQSKLEKIRHACFNLPFEEVGEQVETVKITKDIIKIWDWLQSMLSHPNNTQDDLDMRNLIMKKLGVSTWRMIELGEWKHEDNRHWKVVKPTTMVSLSLWPGEGCESSDLHFQRIRGKYICKSFCKTQYATHFARCHLLVIQLLDMLKAEGFNVDVYDEGEYWESRDIKVLAKNINESTALIAGILGSLKSAIADRGIVVEAPIENSKNYMKVDED